MHSSLELTIIVTGDCESSVSRLNGGSHSSKVSPESSSSTKCSYNSNMGTVTVVETQSLVLLPLAAHQLELFVYTAHATRYPPKLQHPVVSRTHVCLLLRWSKLATLFSRSRFPADVVTMNWASVQKVFLVRVQSPTDLLHRSWIQVLDVAHASMLCTNSCMSSLHITSAPKNSPKKEKRKT
jgi:hypothetical protein